MIFLGTAVTLVLFLSIYLYIRFVIAGNSLFLKLSPLFILAVISLIVARDCKKYLGYSLGIAHLYHSFVRPSDLFDPVVMSDFDLSKAGYSKTFNLHAKYYEIYDIGIVPTSGSIPSKFKFNGELLIEITSDNEVIYVDRVSKTLYSIYSDGERNQYKLVAFASFPIPLDCKNTAKNLFLRVSVVKPDSSMNNLPNGIKLFVAVSGNP